MDNYVLANEVLLGHITLQEALQLTSRADDLLRILKIRRSMRLAIRSAFYYRMARKYATSYVEVAQYAARYRDTVSQYATSLESLLKQQEIKTGHVNSSTKDIATIVVNDVSESPIVKKYAKKLKKSEQRIASFADKLNTDKTRLYQQFKESERLSAVFKTASIMASISDILDYLAEELGN